MCAGRQKSPLSLEVSERSPRPIVEDAGFGRHRAASARGRKLAKGGGRGLLLPAAWRGAGRGCLRSSPLTSCVGAPRRSSGVGGGERRRRRGAAEARRCHEPIRNPCVTETFSFRLDSVFDHPTQPIVASPDAVTYYYGLPLLLLQSLLPVPGTGTVPGCVRPGNIRK